MIFLKKKDEIRYPKELNSHFEQMVNTIKMLQNSGLVKEFILPVKKRVLDKIKGTEYYQITWEYNASSVNEKNFLSVEAYKILVSNRSYQMVLFDNSIIRCSLTFDKEGRLLSQNFSYIPCPINCFFDREISIDDISDMINEGYMILETNDLLMRTTVRFDYDSSKDTKEHPANHVHMQCPGTRMLTNGPICFNKFIKRIIENFYPISYYVKKDILEKDDYGQIDKLDFIKIKKVTSTIQCYNLNAEYKL